MKKDFEFRVLDGIAATAARRTTRGGFPSSPPPRVLAGSNQKVGWRTRIQLGGRPWNFSIISKLADAGFVFAPASMGMTRSTGYGWPDLATNDKQPSGNGSGKARPCQRCPHGAGFVLDADDVHGAEGDGLRLRMA